MTLLAALDVGASEIKAAIFDKTGCEICNARSVNTPTSPGSGWAEIPGEALLERPVQVLAEAVKSSRVDPASILAVGVTGSRATILPVSAQGEPVGPAILWYDRRAGAEVELLESRVGADDFYRLTGVPLDPTPSVVKMMWLRQNRPEIFSAASVFVLPQTAAINALTGAGWFCDHSYGSYYGLMDLESRRWSRTLLDAANVAERLLPHLVEPGALIGTLKPIVARETGLSTNTQVVASGSDAACFKLGAGVEGKGVASVYLGTAGAAGMIVDRAVPDRRLTCCPAALPGYWDADALLLTGASAYRWIRDVLTGLDDTQEKIDYPALDGVAANAPVGSDGVTFIPNLAGAGTPLWDPQASGIFSGLRLSHGPAHLARAVLEGVIFSQRHALEVLEQVVAPIKQLQFTGGGAASPFWSQMLADATGFPVTVPGSQESTALGAAMMAGLAVGVFRNHEEAIGGMSRVETRFDPDRATKEEYDLAYRAYRRVLERMERRKIT
jgi:xylulokinase